jgi:hypothetical protein|tara:strand:- start:58 stop:657 length:600 start_codon:yes stop_codon:yes gene_type:complete
MEAASKGDIAELNRLQATLKGADKAEREALLEATRAERDSFQTLVGEAVEGISIGDVAYSLVVRHPGKDDQSISLSLTSYSLLGILKNALGDVLAQSPESVQSVTIDADGVRLNTSSSVPRVKREGEGNSVGWSNGNGTVGLDSIFTAHATAADKAVMENIKAGKGSKGDKKGRDQRQQNSDANTLKKKVAKRAGYAKA